MINLESILTLDTRVVNLGAAFVSTFNFQPRPILLLPRTVV
jgi:hypothetical protein